MPSVTLSPLSAEPSSQDRDALSELLGSCVTHGASIGFMLPLNAAELTAYWNKVISENAAKQRLILVARDATGKIIGSGQVAFESRANGRHRAEIQKLMVLPEYRGKGIAARLMVELELFARQRSVRLLFLDTSEGHSGARPFYEHLGYSYVGGIPGYALDPDGTPAKNAIFYREL